MHNDDAKAQAVLEIEDENENEMKPLQRVNLDDFFSDAPLDVESAVTGKTCNIFDPECEACQ